MNADSRDNCKCLKSKPSWQKQPYTNSTQSKNRRMRGTWEGWKTKEQYLPQKFTLQKALSCDSNVSENIDSRICICTTKARVELVGIEKYLELKSLSCVLQGGASYRNTNIDRLNQGWGKYTAKYGQRRELGTQLSSQFICVSHPAVCDINRILNLAMIYFYIVHFYSHFSICIYHSK